MKTCGVFGVSYHESVSYAIENRKEFEKRGEEIVKQLHAMCREKYEKQDSDSESDDSDSKLQEEIV